MLATLKQSNIQPDMRRDVKDSEGEEDKDVIEVSLSQCVRVKH